MATKQFCRNKGKLILPVFFARSPDVSAVLFCYYLLGGDIAATITLLARLCHAFLILNLFSDLSETNYLKIRWTDFRNLFTEWKPFGCRWSTWTSFLISQGTLPWQPILWQNYLPLIVLAFRNGMGYRRVYAWLNSATNATTSCKILVKVGPAPTDKRKDTHTQ